MMILWVTHIENSIERRDTIITKSFSPNGCRLLPYTKSNILLSVHLDFSLCSMHYNPPLLNLLCWNDEHDLTDHRAVAPDGDFVLKSKKQQWFMSKSSFFGWQKPFELCRRVEKSIFEFNACWCSCMLQAPLNSLLSSDQYSMPLPESGTCQVDTGEGKDSTSFFLMIS